MAVTVQVRHDGRRSGVGVGGTQNGTDAGHHRGPPHRLSCVEHADDREYKPGLCRPQFAVRNSPQIGHLTAPRDGPDRQWGCAVAPRRIERATRGGRLAPSTPERARG
jgi:hypothetical protein